VVFSKELANFDLQSEEEVGSAGEQPTSNKIDGHTVKGWFLTTLFFYWRPFSL
jgi:hypothetical protein